MIMFIGVTVLFQSFVRQMMTPRRTTERASSCFALNRAVVL